MLNWKELRAKKKDSIREMFFFFFLTSWSNLLLVAPLMKSLSGAAPHTFGEPKLQTNS